MRDEHINTTVNHFEHYWWFCSSAVLILIPLLANGAICVGKK